MLTAAYRVYQNSAMCASDFSSSSFGPTLVLLIIYHFYCGPVKKTKEPHTYHIHVLYKLGLCAGCMFAELC